MLNFFTDFTVPIRASICFSITKGDKDVIGLSLFVDSMIKNFAKFSCVLNKVEVSISSLSESDRGRLCVRVAMIADFIFQQLCASPALEPYKGTLYGNGSPISNAKATLLSYSSFTFPTYLKLLMIYGW